MDSYEKHVLLRLLCKLCSTATINEATAKKNCKTLLTTLLDLSAMVNEKAAKNVQSLIQSLVDGELSPEDFATRLQEEINCMLGSEFVTYLEKGLPPLRLSLATKELTIEGIRPPALSGSTSAARCFCASFLFSTDYSDVTISCGPKEFPAHKLVICSKSNVLKTTFDQPMAEGLSGKMNIDDFEPEVVEEFLRFLYTEEVLDLPTHAVDLILMAEKYDVQDLKTVSERSIVGTVSAENAIELYALGKLVNSEPIVCQCVEKIRKDKKLIWKTEAEFHAACQQCPGLLYEVLV